MKRYETVLIVDTDLSDEEMTGLIDRYGAIITGMKGLVMKLDRWGKRKLAYEVKKQTKGYYILIDYAGESAIVTELERNFKIDDKVLKYMTIMKVDQVRLEELEKELAALNAPPPEPAPLPEEMKVQGE